MILPLLFTLLTLPLAPDVEESPDLVVLRDGKEVDCRVLYEDKTKVVYRAKRKNVEVPAEEVLRIDSVERNLRTFLQRYTELDPKQVQALSELAHFAENCSLPGEAQNLWIRILTLDPENEEAWKKLGGVKGRKGWQIKIRSRFYSLEEMRERVGDWKNALELRTAHYVVKTDGPPERALDVAIDLERAHQAFYDALGPALGLYVYDETPEIHIPTDAKDYPVAPVPGDRVWFSRLANTLYVDGSSKPNPNEVVAELAEVMTFNALRRATGGKTGEIEPWAREGLAQIFGGSIRPDPGRARFDFEAPILPYFKAQASDPDALPLEKVLRMSLMSTDSGKDQERYTRQAYTLTHFLVFAESGKYRQRFGEYLRASYLGKTGTSNFYAVLKVDPKALEAEWKAYVQGVGG